MKTKLLFQDHELNKDIWKNKRELFEAYFGDFYEFILNNNGLEDLKKYREEKLSERNFSAMFPLWGRDTKALAEGFIQAGFKTKICAADADKISKDWVGRDYDRGFLAQLSADVDPCGENGEFHSFCYEGPIYSKPLDIVCKEVIQQSYDIMLENGDRSKKNYWFAEMLKS